MSWICENCQSQDVKSLSNEFDEYLCGPCMTALEGDVVASLRSRLEEIRQERDEALEDKSILQEANKNLLKELRAVNERNDELYHELTKVLLGREDFLTISTWRFESRRRANCRVKVDDSSAQEGE